MKKLIMILMLAVFVLIGCGMDDFAEVYTHESINKNSEIWLYNRMESAPFIFDGELFHMVFDHHENKIEIYKNFELIHEFESIIKFGCCLMEDGRLYIFGSTKVGTYGNSIYVMHTDDLVNFSDPIPIYSDPGRAIFNVSVDKDDNGYVLAYETDEQNHKRFSGRFLHSVDLENWSPIGGFFRPNVYAACPTIRYIDGYYYVFYLFDCGHWFTCVSRSTDLINWEHASNIVLSSLDNPSEGNNNSDMDLIEYNGRVVINYAIGDQQTWGAMKIAYYDGTLGEFVGEFF